MTPVWKSPINDRPRERAVRWPLADILKRRRPEPRLHQEIHWRNPGSNWVQIYVRDVGGPLRLARSVLDPQR